MNPDLTVDVLSADEGSISDDEEGHVVGPSQCTVDPSEAQQDQEPQSDSPEEDPAAASAISLSKTPIMKMKTKCEPKRIPVSLKSADETGDGLGGGDGELGGEQEPIEAPLGPMTPVEVLLHDSMKLGGGGVSPASEQQRKMSSVLPAGLAQVHSWLLVSASSSGTPF